MFELGAAGFSLALPEAAAPAAGAAFGAAAGAGGGVSKLCRDATLSGTLTAAGVLAQIELLSGVIKS